MSRKLLGYRVRAERNGSIVYATGGEAYLWHETPGRPETREECRQSKRIALYMNRENPATNVKIVAVYLRIGTCVDCEEYKRTNAYAILAHQRLDDLGIPNHEQTMRGGSKVLRLHDRVAQEANVEAGFPVSPTDTMKALKAALGNGASTWHGLVRKKLHEWFRSNDV